jgi:branched-chain amino acid transport system ATP-binding protein
MLDRRERADENLKTRMLDQRERADENLKTRMLDQRESSRGGAALSIVDVSKAYGKIKAVAGVSFDVLPGEAIGVIGPNGAGKSTLFDIVSGAVKADSGRVLLGGRDVTSEPPHLRCRAGVGRTYQIPQTFVRLSVFENVLVAVQQRRERPRDGEQVALSVLHRAGLFAMRNTAAEKLTLLWRKRLEVARALATAPRVLLLDEVAAGLTEHEFSGMAELIRAVCKEGIAVLWVEHAVHLLAPLVDRLLAMHFGEVVALGPTQQVLADPRVQEVYLGLNGAEEPPHGASKAEP